jgi:glycosyltransferase involved in cell wall biosynthesis
MPKFSIITVCKNAEQNIERTIRSVIEQNFRDYEYIVIDGKSTDRTMEIINAYRQNIAKFISELDIGIYDAMNKGIGLASGEYLLFLNAGDIFLHKNVLSIVAVQLAQSSVDIFYGHILKLDTSTGRCELSLQYPVVDSAFLFNYTIAHQAAFIHKEAFHKVGLYDATLRIVGDWEWFLRAFLRFHCSYRYYNFVCVIYRLDGLSESDKPQIQNLHYAERYAVRKRYFNIFLRILYASHKNADFCSGLYRKFSRFLSKYGKMKGDGTNQDKV